MTSAEFKILYLDETNKHMVIDWGYITLNHEIPLYILENPGMSAEEIRQHIEYMRPEAPIDLPVPSALLGMVTPVVPPTPEEVLQQWREEMVVSAFQAKAMLLQAGYWEDVQGILADADPVTALAWESAQEFRRMSPTVLEIVEALSISDAELDDLFRFAATIQA